MSDLGRRHPAKVASIAWIPTRELDAREWAGAGCSLGAMARWGQRDLGDWIRYGEARFGERYTAVARTTGYYVQDLLRPFVLSVLAGHVGLSTESRGPLCGMGGCVVRHYRAGKWPHRSCPHTPLDR
jgi:hypothetical protein